MTRMGPREGMDTEKSVQGMRTRIDHFKLAQSGKFLAFDSREIPW